MEGDTSLPEPEDAFVPTVLRHWVTISDAELDINGRGLAIGAAAHDLLARTLPQAFLFVRKWLDLLGNDFYLAHIFRSLHWWTKPTHVTVLGDLIGSQWVTDDEFDVRGWRYWTRIFRGGEMIEQQGFEHLETHIQQEPRDWSHKIINLVGNHDIGYAGDISDHRIGRFEKVFGPANWDIRFQFSSAESPVQERQEQQQDPSLHLIVLNSLSLDTPALSEPIQSSTYEFINNLINSHSKPVEDGTSFTLLLTHLPLHKPSGVCVDEPFFNFWDHTDDDGRFEEGGLREQNHLSEHASQNVVLQGIFGKSGDLSAPAQGKGRNGLILTGHDHEGCDVWHHIPSTDSTSPDSSWQSIRYTPILNTTASQTGIREITLRSMMGEYGGNAGLLSAWFDFETGKWEYDIQMCKLGVQHIWWTIHIVDLITLLMAILWVCGRCVGAGQTKTLILEPVEKENERSKSGEKVLHKNVDGGTEQKKG